MEESLFGIIGVVFGGISAVLVAYLSARTEWRRARAGKEESFEDRVERLSRSLSEAGRVVGQLEQEIKSRQQLVDHLREEQQLLELSRDEVDAVAQTLRGELRREGRKSFWLVSRANKDPHW
jgi:TolA-binding protein